MKSAELLRMLRRLGAVVNFSRGKGGHVRVELNSRDSCSNRQQRSQARLGAWRVETAWIATRRPFVMRTTMVRSSGSEAWPVALDRADEGGFLVSFPDLPGGLTQGDDRNEALSQAEIILEEMILGAMAHNEDVQMPSPVAGREAASSGR